MTSASGAPTTAQHVALADAFFAAEQAMTRAGRIVDDLDAVVVSALRILDDAELASDQASLTTREQRLLGSAEDHLQRLRIRSNELPQFTEELEKQLTAATREIARADQLLDRIDVRPEPRAQTGPATAPGLLTSRPPSRLGSHFDRAEDLAVRDLRTRAAVLSEVVDLARPMAEAVTAIVTSSWEANGIATARDPSDLRAAVERNVQLANNQLGRLEGSVRPLHTVLDRAALRAQESVDVAAEISEQTRDRITAATHRAPGPTSTGFSPATRSPTR